MIYLASQSPRRGVLLRKARIRFRRIRSSYQEKINTRQTPAQNAKRNALGKCKAAHCMTGICLAADTIVVCRGKILGKPKNQKDAKRMLSLLSGKTHEVITGVAIKNCLNGKLKLFAVKSKVTFKELSATQIVEYIRTGEPMDKAGAYGYQGKGGAFVKRVQGSKTNIIGLPTEHLKTVILSVAKDPTE